MKVLKNYLYNMVYQVFILIVPLVTIPYISRVLGPSGVGINTLTTSVAQYFGLLANLGLSTYGQRQIAYQRSNKEQMSRTFWEIEIVSLVTALFSLLLFLVFICFVDKYRVYYLAQAFLIFSSAADISWLFMGLEKFKITVFRNFLVKLLSIILIFTFVIQTTDLLKYILIITVTTLIGNLSLWPYLKNYVFKPSFSTLVFKKHIRPAFALFIPQVAINVYTVLNKIMLGTFSTVVAAGYFDSSDKIIRMLLTLITAFSTVMMPHVANAYFQGKEKSVVKMLNNGLSFAIAMSLPMIALLNATASKLVPWFFGEKFLPVASTLQIESFAIFPIACAGIIGAQYLVPLNMNRQYTFSIFGGAIVNVIINIPLLHYFQANGAAFAAIIAECFVTGLQFVFIRGKINLKKFQISFFKAGIASLLAFFLVRLEISSWQVNLISFAIEGVTGVSIYLGSLFFLRYQGIFDLLILLKSSMIKKKK